MSWEAWAEARIQERVREALKANLSYEGDEILGFPGSSLDERVFPAADFLDGKAYLSCLRENPNHIGCVTSESGEPAFAGTRELEREALEFCAEGLCGAAPGGWDGYVSSGGTESNIQALWVWRNELRTHGIKESEQIVIFSRDTHYSLWKACDLLGLESRAIKVDRKRQIELSDVRVATEELRAKAKRAVILVLNMGTSHFGVCDDLHSILALLSGQGLEVRVHVDAAFGGFLWPLLESTPLSFRSASVGTMTLDAHKALRTPFGTGVFLARKGLMELTRTEKASYVPGGDLTLCGSRSGANAVALWMVLRSRGLEGLRRMARELSLRADIIGARLRAMRIPFLRNPPMPILALPASEIPRALAEKFHLVADNASDTEYWKLVVMPHVREKSLDAFFQELAESRRQGLVGKASAS